MSKKLLVAYASRAGSTAGVAEVVGEMLAMEGWQVDVRPMGEVKDVGDYQAVVAGSAIQKARWLPEAMTFLRDQQPALRRLPCAVFLVCMTLAMRNGERYRPTVAGFLEPVRALVEPVSEGLFAGALDIRRVPSPADRVKFRLSVLLKVWSDCDHRDWEAIRTWARSLNPLLAR